MSISRGVEKRSLFGSSGIRLAFGRQLVDIAFGLGLVCGRQYRDVLVGRDTRTSSDLLKNLLVSGLQAAGARVLDAGIVPTPTLALAARKVDLGIMVTASHNPPEYNGFKVIEPNGSGIRPDKQIEIEEGVQRDGYQLAKWTDLGLLENHSTAVDEHLDAIRRNCQPLERKTKVVVDSCCGAASYVTPMVLAEMGCEVVPMNCNPSGYPPRGAEPTEANLTELARTVSEQGADLGIAHDVDADRVMIIDDEGRFVPGDKLMVILAQAFDFKEIVTTLDASMVLEELGFQVTRTKIGDVYVSWEVMNSGGFGGEPSGSWIFPEVSLCPDGIYAAAKIASLASRSKLSELVDRIPGYPIIRGSIDDYGISLDDLEKTLLQKDDTVVNVCRIDGLKVFYNDGWMLVRRSGTQPILRLTIEARSYERMRVLYQSVLDSIQSCSCY